ncbi:MAG: RNA polymerase sigma factor [Chloroflexaceae bacterium]|jgi:RNA polymerase sigma-70 factor (ECF subfamily)|nr:RNA polymerase sigma factor [Chloroflexaceae bacterium]
MEEHDAIARLKRGDIRGLEMLVQAHQHEALKLAYLVTFDMGLAEDVVQSAFLRVYERIEQFDQRRAFKPWFLRSVVNAAITAAQRNARQVPLPGPNRAETGAGAEVAAPATWEPAVLLERMETQNEVKQALAQLSPAQRAVIVQRYYLEMSEAQIASYWAAPPGTVKWRLHAARERLRTMLASVWALSSPSDRNHS